MDWAALFLPAMDYVHFSDLQTTKNAASKYYTSKYAFVSSKLF